MEFKYELTLDEYMALKAWQGGVCYGCGRARGQSKNLCVDHNHDCDAGHPPERGCRKCIRALLCSYCNEVEGRLSVEALARLIEVKVNPPAQRFFRGELG